MLNKKGGDLRMEASVKAKREKFDEMYFGTLRLVESIRRLSRSLGLLLSVESI